MHATCRIQIEKGELAGEITGMKGIYTLIISLSEKIHTKVGGLGAKTFPDGHYTYTGSALGTGAASLKRRVSRHLRKTGKKKHWHIDFLLAHRNATVTSVVVAETEDKIECKLNYCVKKEGVARIPLSGFGSSDCQGNCESHLLYHPQIQKDLELRKKIVKCYECLGLTPVQITPQHCSLYNVEDLMSV